MTSETFNLSCVNDNKRIIHILAPNPGSGTRVGRKTLLLKAFHVKVGNHCGYWRPTGRAFSLSVVISLVHKIDGREAELEQGYDFAVSRRSQGDSLYVEPLYP